MEEQTYAQKKAELGEILAAVNGGQIDLDAQIRGLTRANELRQDLLSMLEGQKVKVQGLMA